MGKIDDYARSIARGLEIRSLENDVIAINLISLQIHLEYPLYPYARRRELAKIVMEEERQRRKSLAGVNN